MSGAARSWIGARAAATASVPPLEPSYGRSSSAADTSLEPGGASSLPAGGSLAATGSVVSSGTPDGELAADGDGSGQSRAHVALSSPPPEAPSAAPSPSPGPPAASAADPPIALPSGAEKGKSRAASGQLLAENGKSPALMALETDFERFMRSLADESVLLEPLDDEEPRAARGGEAGLATDASVGAAAKGLGSSGGGRGHPGLGEVALAPAEPRGQHADRQLVGEEALTASPSGGSASPARQARGEVGGSLVRGTFAGSSAQDAGVSHPASPAPAPPAPPPRPSPSPPPPLPGLQRLIADAVRPAALLRAARAGEAATLAECRTLSTALLLAGPVATSAWLLSRPAALGDAAAGLLALFAFEPAAAPLLLRLRGEPGAHVAPSAAALALPASSSSSGAAAPRAAAVAAADLAAGSAAELPRMPFGLRHLASSRAYGAAADVARSLGRMARLADVREAEKAASGAGGSGGSRG